MQKKLIRLLTLLIIMISFSSCAVVEGIFKAGMSVGIFFVIAILVIIVYVISKVSGKK